MLNDFTLAFRNKIFLYLDCSSKLHDVLSKNMKKESDARYRWRYIKIMILKSVEYRKINP